MTRIKCLLVLLCVASVVNADNWPAWRGPTGLGASQEKALPLKWSTKENVRWKVALPAAGNSTPIIWGDRVFITQAGDLTRWPPKVPANYAGGASAGGHAVAEKRSVMCFNRTDGKLLWERHTIYKEPEITHPTNPFCSASPVTDGERVIASHGSAGLVCYDLEGKLLWHYEVGKIEHLWGNASSPILHGDLCILWCGPGERQFLLAVNKRTGKRVWETPLAGGDAGITTKNFLGSWATPIVARVGAEDQLVFPLPFKLMGFDLKSGKELWSAKGPGTYCYSSPLVLDNIAVYGGTLVKLGGTGDITKDRLKHKVGSMFIGTAAVSGDYLYVLNGVGVPECYEWKTGKELWKSEIGERPGNSDAWGSPVFGAGRMYITDRRGTTLVFAAGPKYEHLATNPLGEHTDASIAISGGDIFIRTHKHLWCIGERKEGKAALKPEGDASVKVTGIKAVHRHGQTFVTWKDAAEGEAGAQYRYSLYRSDQPITPKNLAQAELRYRGVLNNSARLFGTAFQKVDRLDAAKPYSIIEEGGKPLPPWSGLAVCTVRRAGKSYYGVVVTDDKLKPLSEIVPGESATTEPIDEESAPTQAIKLYDSKQRSGPYVANTSITGKKGLPLHVTLHGSNSRGGGAGEYGDYYLFFGDPQMGFRDGLPGVFSIEEHRSKPGNRLVLRARDGLEHPSGRGNMESYWFGYYCVPEGAKHTDPRVYPFTENQLLWMTRWAIDRYSADPMRISMGGASSGGVGSWIVGLRHPDLFAAVYPNIGRVRNVEAIALFGNLKRGAPAIMDDGKTSYYDRADAVKFVAAHTDDLPFVGFACGRRDGYATWQENIDMVKALTAARHGFAFSWNNGDHGGGGQAMTAIQKYYPAELFARNVSYPAFGNSSLDNNMGSGDPKDGDLVGGINLGFSWKDGRDEENLWSVALANELAKAQMTVDVTPRRCQKFKPRPGAELHWSSSLGASGKIVVDRWGLVTVPRLAIDPGKAMVLTIHAKGA